MEIPIEWLLDGPAFVRYRVRRDLLGQREEDVEVAADRCAMLADPLVQGLLEELTAWPGAPVSSHKSAGQLFHKLGFVADLGLCADDPGMGEIIERILALRSPEGPFAFRMNIGKAHGGAGEDLLAWALCDTPLVLYALLKFGLGTDERVRVAGEHLLSLGRDDAARGLFGWPCEVSGTLGGWRGPGRKDDPCPFANLAMLKALAQDAVWREAAETHAGAETLLSLWAESRSRHPYIFYMGTDFRKLKAPFVWYDLLHVTEALTQLPWLRGDPRLREMVDLVAGKADAQGRFTGESVWQAWGAWEFGQKKTPSRWLTLLAHRMVLRMGDMEMTDGI